MEKSLSWQIFWILTCLFITSCSVHHQKVKKSMHHRTDSIKKLSKKEKSNNALIKYVWPVNDHKNQQVHFSDTGLDIQTKRPVSVVAISEGRVIYVGEGLSQYGKMIMVRHAQDVVSVYSRNQLFLVKEGDYVKARQKIATTRQLHFELRRYGKPVNPKLYLG